VEQSGDGDRGDVAFVDGSCGGVGVGGADGARSCDLGGPDEVVAHEGAGAQERVTEPGGGDSVLGGLVGEAAGVGFAIGHRGRREQDYMFDADRANGGEAAGELVGGEQVEPVDPVERAGDGGGVGEVARPDVGLGGQVGGIGASGERADGVACGEEPLDDVAADRSGGAGDQDGVGAHDEVTPSWRLGLAACESSGGAVGVGSRRGSSQEVARAIASRTIPAPRLMVSASPNAPDLAAAREATGFADRVVLVALKSRVTPIEAESWAVVLNSADPDPVSTTGIPARVSRASGDHQAHAASRITTIATTHARPAAWAPVSDTLIPTYLHRAVTAWCGVC
jgi:hypothetical protein